MPPTGPGRVASSGTSRPWPTHIFPAGKLSSAHSLEFRTMQAALPAQDDIRIAILGLGYVGLPLAAAFGKRYPVL